VVLFLLGCAFILAVVAPLTRTLGEGWSSIVTGLLAGGGALALTILFAGWDRIRLADVGATPKPRSLLRVGAGLALGFLLAATWALLSAAVGYVRWDFGPTVGASTTAGAVVGFLVLASREELAFRGYPLRRLKTALGLTGAQVVVALAFALEHKLAGATWAEAIFGAGVGSVLFGMAAIASRGLAVPIGLHAAWNVGQWALGLRGSAGIWHPAVREAQKAEVAGLSIYVLLAGSMAVAIWLWHRRE
jgi:membrane protease YdiL (CAAX protease family)